MKNKKIFTLMLLATAFTFQNCSTAKSTTKTDSKTETSKSAIVISNLEKSYTVKVGQQLTYTANVHGSVGTACMATTNDENIVKLTDTKTNYNKPQVEGMTGGDAAKQVFTFEAKAAGTTKVVIKDYDRGTVTNTYEIEIIVN